MPHFISAFLYALFRVWKLLFVSPIRYVTRKLRAAREHPRVGHWHGARASRHPLWRPQWLIVCMGALCSIACFETIGRKLGDGASASLRANGPEVVNEVVVSARDTLAEPETQQTLIKLEDAILEAARKGAIGEATKQKLQALLDASFATVKVNATETEAELADAFIKDIGRARETALGKQTEARVNQLKGDLLDDLPERMSEVVDSALSDTKLAHIREELVGAPLRESVHELLTGVLSTAEEGLPRVVKAVLEPANQDLEKARNEARRLLFELFGAVLVLIFGAVAAAFYLRKHRRVIRVITKKVEERNDTELKRSIQKAADEAGVEDYLHMLLQKNGIPTRAPESGRRAA